MGKLIKIILVLFSSVTVLFVAAAIMIPLFVDLNDYKTEMEVVVQEKTGRTLKIEGDLDLSVFPWLGVSTGKIVLSNAEGFAENPFAVIGEAEIKVKLLPLFSKQIEVSTVLLKDLELHLEKNKQGTSNWDDLATPKETGDQLPDKSVKNLASSSQKDHAQIPDQKVNAAIDRAAQKDIATQPIAGKVEQLAEPGSTEQEINNAIDLAAIKIGGLVIENSLISWHDQQSGQHIIVKDFNFSSGVVAFNKPIAIKLSLLLENAEPAVTEQLDLSMHLVIDAALQKIQLANFSLDSVTKGESIPGGQLNTQLKSDIILNIQEQTLTLKQLQLSTNSIHLTGELNASKLNTDLQYTGALKIASFSPKELLQQLQISVPETADKQVLQKLAISFALQGSKDSVALENLKITLDDTTMTGYTRIKQFDQPAVTFQLAIDDIDLDRYSAPKLKQENKPQKTQTAIAKTKTAVAESPLLPIDTLRTLNVNGDLTIEKLKVAQLTMAGVSLNIKAKNGIVQTRQSIKQLYQGKYRGQITINAKGKTPRISLNEKISSIQLEPLLNDLQPDSVAKLKGKANITAKLTTKGNTITAIKSKLAGKLSFSLKKGAIRGFNVQKIIDIGKLATKGKQMQQSYANEQTLFTIIKGSASVKKGLINNPDFLAESSTIKVKGRGTVNLVTEALDYNVLAKLKKGGKNITNRPVAINVQGTISNPTLSYPKDLQSIESMMTEKEKKKVDKFVNKHEKEIDKALGEGSGKAVKELLKGFFK